MVATLKRDSTVASASHSVESKGSPSRLALTGPLMNGGYPQGDELKNSVRHCIIHVQRKGTRDLADEVGMIRLVLVDDQGKVRQGLRMRLLLEPDIAVVGEASNGKEALALVQQLRPDVVLMDIEMPEMDGISATAALHSIVPRSAVVILSIHEDNVTQTRAQVAGAAAFVAKRGSTDELLAAIYSASQSTR